MVERVSHRHSTKLDPMNQIPSSNRRTALVLIALASLLLAAAIVFGDARVRGLVRNTSFLVAAVIAISVPLGTSIAFLLARFQLPGRKLLTLGWGAAVFIPIYLQAAAWEAGFGSQGWYSLQKQEFHRPLLDGWYGAIWIHAMAAIPWVTLIMFVTFRYPAKRLEDAASLDASGTQVFFHITLRRSLPGLALAGLWVGIITATEITVTDMKQIRTFAEEAFMSLVLGEDPLDLAAMTLLTGTLVGLTLSALAIAASNLSPRHLDPSQPPAFLDRKLSGWRWPLTILQLSTFSFFVLFPIGNLIYKASRVVVVEDGVKRSFWSITSFCQQYFGAIWEFRAEFFWSTAIGLVTAVTTVLLATLLVVLASNRQRAVALAFILGICLATPGPIIGHLTVLLLNCRYLPPLVFLYDNTIAAPVLALTVRALPFATLVLWFAATSVSQATIHSALLDGCTRWQLWWRIIVPQRRWFWLLAIFVAFTTSWNEVGSLSNMVVPPGINLVSKEIFDLIHFGVEDRLAGLCLMTLTYYVVLLGLLFGSWRISHVGNAGRRSA
ncbi:MAG: iron(III) transport system permease protein [Pirellulaceae bacterium]|jgi:iron(III) transport system permease protein